MSIAWEDVTTIAPKMSDVTLSAQAMILAYVNEVLDDTDDAWGDGALFTVGGALLAAHFGALQLRNSANGPAGPVTSMGLGDASKSFAAPMLTTRSALMATTYGREYLTLCDSLPSAMGFVC
jgi:hypothetical protein